MKKAPAPEGAEAYKSLAAGAPQFVTRIGMST